MYVRWNCVTFKIKNNKLYPIIYEDCKAFIENLYHNNYLKEVN